MRKPSIITTSKAIKKLPTINENFGLTREEFTKYVDNLMSGDDSLITDILANHLPESISYLRFKFKITQEIAYDVCLDTFLEFRNKLLCNKIKYGNLRYLFTRMCINQYIDKQKNQIKLNTSIQEFLKNKNNSTEIKEAFFTKLDVVISELSEDQQYLLKELYYTEKDMSVIALEQGISYAALRKKKERVLKKIKSLFFN